MIDDKNAVKKHRCPQLQIVAKKKKDLYATVLTIIRRARDNYMPL